MGSFTPYEKANTLCISVLQNQSVSRSVSKKIPLNALNQIWKNETIPLPKKGWLPASFWSSEYSYFNFPIFFYRLKPKDMLYDSMATYEFRQI